MDDFDPCAFGRMGELQAIFGIIVANQEAWSDSEGCCVAHLLGEPCIGRVSGHTDVDHPPRAVFNQEKQKHRPEK